MWTIYTYGNGDIISQILQGLVLLLGSSSYSHLIHLGALVGLVGVLGLWAFSQRFPGQVLVAIVLVMVFATQFTADVSVEDQVNPLIPAVVVTDVPMVVALPAYLSGSIGWRVINLMETVFSVPGVFTMSGNTVNRSWFDLQKTLDVALVDSDLRRNLDQFLVKCLIPGMNLNQVSRATIQNSTDLLTDIGLADNPVLSADVYTGGIVTGLAPCNTYYTTYISTQFAETNAAYAETMQRFRTKLQADPALVGDQSTYVDPVITALGFTQTTDELLNNMIIRQAIVSAERKERALAGDTAETLNLNHESLTQQLKEQAYLVGETGQKVVAIVRTMAEGMIYMIGPLLLVFALQVGVGKWVGAYLRLFLWLQLWGPILVVVNFVLFWEGANRIPDIAGGALGVTLVNYADIREFTSVLNSIASNMFMAVPFLSWAAVGFFGAGLGALAQGARGPAEKAESVGAAFASGRGQALREGDHYTDQEVNVGNGQTGQMAVPSGMLLSHQSGAQEVLHHDGSTTTFERGGNLRHSGSAGNFVMDSHGKLVHGSRTSRGRDSQGNERLITETIGEGGAKKVSAPDINPFTGNLAQKEMFVDSFSGDHLKTTYSEQRENERSVFEVSADGQAVETSVYKGSVQDEATGNLYPGELTSMRVYHAGEIEPRMAVDVPAQFHGTQGYENIRGDGIRLEDSPDGFPVIRFTESHASNKNQKERVGQGLEDIQLLDPRGQGVAHQKRYESIEIEGLDGKIFEAKAIVTNEDAVSPSGERTNISSTVVSTSAGLVAQGEFREYTQESPVLEDGHGVTYGSDGLPEKKLKRRFKATSIHQNKVDDRETFENGLAYHDTRGHDPLGAYIGSGDIGEGVGGVKILSPEGKHFFTLPGAHVEEKGVRESSSGIRFPDDVRLSGVNENMAFNFGVTREPGDPHAFRLVSSGRESGNQVRLGVKNGPHGLPAELRMNEDQSFTFTETGNRALPISVAPGHVEQVDGEYEFSGTARLNPGKMVGEPDGFKFHTEVGSVRFQGPGLYGDGGNLETHELGLEDEGEFFSVTHGNIEALVERSGAGMNARGHSSIQHEQRDPGSGELLSQQVSRKFTDEEERVHSFRGEATFKELFANAPSEIKNMPVFANIQFGRDGSILSASGESGATIEYMDPDRGAVITKFDSKNGFVAFHRAESGTQLTRHNTERSEGAVVWPGDNGQVFKGSGQLEFDPETHELVSANLSSLAVFQVGENGGVKEKYLDPESGEFIASKGFSGQLQEGVFYSTGVTGAAEAFGGREIRDRQGNLVTAEGNQTIQKVMATPNDALARVHESNTGQRLFSDTVKGEQFRKTYMSTAEFGPVHLMLEAGHALVGEEFDPTNLSKTDEHVIDAVGAGRMTMDTAWEVLKGKYLKEGLLGKKGKGGGHRPDALKPGSPVIP